MDFALTEDQAAIQSTVRAFADEKIAPFALQWEDERAIPRQVLREPASLGLGGITVSEEHGGSALSRVESVLIFEALATACPAVA
ncbi:MAG: acyl-CoA dehydrogenase family protein, partial [Parvibaculaceae bacterium]